MGFIITLYLFELISFQQFHVQILYNGNIQRKNHFYVWMNGKQKTETIAYPYLGQRDPGYARTQYRCRKTECSETQWIEKARDPYSIQKPPKIMQQKEESTSKYMKHIKKWESRINKVKTK